MRIECKHNREVLVLLLFSSVMHLGSGASSTAVRVAGSKGMQKGRWNDYVKWNKSGSVHITNIEARSCIHCCRVEAIIIVYSESVFVALCIQHSKSRSHIVISGLSGSTVCFFTLSHKRRDFRNRVFENRMHILIFYTNFVWNISHSKKKWARYD
jgi:hypothetical protein